MIERVVRILSTFDRQRRTQTAAQVARRADLPVSTAYRLVQDLQTVGLLERDEDGGYRVGLRLWELATRGSVALGLREAAIPSMEKVQTRLRQHTQLAVLDDDSTLFIERLSHPEAGANIAQIAGRLPLHASSAGLVLLAHADAELMERIVNGPLPASARGTITDAPTLRRKLAEVRRLGHASATGSVENVSTGVAVPVWHGARVVAALGVVLPADAAPVDVAVEALQAASREIAEALQQISSRSTR